MSKEPENMIHCDHCNITFREKELVRRGEEDDVFCPYCGRSVQTPAAEQEDKPMSGRKAKKNKDQQIPQPDLIGWFINPKTGSLVPGIIIATRGRFVYLALKTQESEMYRMPVDEVFPTSTALLDWRDECSRKKLQGYLDQMPDIESCLQFALANPVSDYDCENDAARTAYIQRVRELTGNPSFGLSKHEKEDLCQE